ncbi:MAG TPA: DUF1801 domain-containing protein [Pyrinomonadaceae bacterium]|jgi:hypothetical protein
MSVTIEKFLAAYSPAVRDLTLKVRALVLKVVPDAVEQVDAASNLIGYGFGLKYADLICVIMPLKSAVNLGFYRGTELPDPKGLLEGTGKRNRHVKLKTETEIENPALRELLKAAVAAKKQ